MLNMAEIYLMHVVGTSLPMSLHWVTTIPGSETHELHTVVFSLMCLQVTSLWPTGHPALLQLQLAHDISNTNSKLRSRAEAATVLEWLWWHEHL